MECPLVPIMISQTTLNNSVLVPYKAFIFIFFKFPENKTPSISYKILQKLSFINTFQISGKLHQIQASKLYLSTWSCAHMGKQNCGYTSEFGLKVQKFKCHPIRSCVCVRNTSGKSYSQYYCMCQNVWGQIKVLNVMKFFKVRCILIDHMCRSMFKIPLNVRLQ